MCAASSPARWRSSAQASASAPRWKPIRSCTCPTPTCSRALVDVDLAEICITSAATLVSDEGPATAFRLPDVSGVAVVAKLAEGTKCARSWKISPAVGSDPEYPDVTPRDAQALREWDTMRARAAQ